MKYTTMRDASNRLVINFNNIPSFLYWWYKRKIIKKYNLKMINSLTKSIDVKFQSFKSDKGNVSLEWDNWSGFSIVSLDNQSENFVLKIAKFLGYPDQSS